jgi:hypothetical protein
MILRLATKHENGDPLCSAGLQTGCRVGVLARIRSFAFLKEPMPRRTKPWETVPHKLPRPKGPMRNFVPHSDIRGGRREAGVSTPATFHTKKLKGLERGEAAFKTLLTHQHFPQCDFRGPIQARSGFRVTSVQSQTQ